MRRAASSFRAAWDALGGLPRSRGEGAPVLSGDCAEGAGRSAKLQKKGWDMPSWNIHIAHAEGLLAKDGPVARVVRDRNAFLFGNLIPDIYVG